MLREEILLFNKLTEKDANNYSINYIGGFLDGYEKGKQDYELKTGKWIDGYCSVCNTSCMCDGWGRDIETTYCPNCGTKMILVTGDIIFVGDEKNDE